MDNVNAYSGAGTSSRLLFATMRPMGPGAPLRELLVDLAALGVADLSVVIASRSNLELIQESFKGCALVPRGIGEWPDDSVGPLSSEALEILPRLTTSDDFLLFKSQVMTMLNRHDGSGTFRLIDREALFYQLFMNLGGLLIDKGVSHVFFDITPHVVTEYITFWVARKLGIPVLFLQPVPWSGLSLPLKDVGVPYQSPKLIPPPTAGEDSAFRELAAEQFQLLLNRLGQGEATWVKKYLGPEMRKLDDTRFRPFRVLGNLRALSRKENSVDLSGVVENFGRLNEFVVALLQWAHRRSFVATRRAIHPGAVPDKPYLFFALTHEPERTFFPEALPWVSQIDAVLAAAGAVRGSHSIVVKEHETQYAPGRVGYASRSTHFYRLLRKIPNVFVVSSEKQAGPLIEGAAGVISATGTICVEAAIKGVPAYHFGNPWWEGFPGTRKIHDFEAFESGFPAVDAYNRGNAREFFEGFMGRAIPSTSNVEPALFRTKNAELPDGYELLEASALTALLTAFLSEGEGPGA